MKRTVCPYCGKIMNDYDDDIRYRCPFCGEYLIDIDKDHCRPEAYYPQNASEVKAVGKWEELRETIQELHENNADKPDVENVTRFLLNLMNVLDGKE